MHKLQRCQRGRKAIECRKHSDQPDVFEFRFLGECGLNSINGSITCDVNAIISHEKQPKVLLQSSTSTKNDVNFVFRKRVEIFEPDQSHVEVLTFKISE